MQTTYDKATKDLKVPPHSLEAEQSVLGGLLIDNNAWDHVTEKIVLDDFFRQEHRAIFQAMMELARTNKPFDVVTLADTLKAHHQLENAGGEVYLFELAKN